MGGLALRFFLDVQEYYVDLFDEVGLAGPESVWFQTALREELHQHR
jgi:hypothetical protein